MRVTSLMPALALSAGLGLASFAPAALAASYSLDFTGSVSAFSVSSLDLGGTHYDFYTLDLGDLTTPLDLQAGDEITAYLTLDGSYTLPSTPVVYFTSVLFLLNDAHGNFPSGNTAASGNVTLYDNGNPTVLPGGTSTSGQIAFGLGLYPPANQGLTISQATFEFTITTMDNPATADHAMVYFTNFTPAVPEPGTVALWLGGLGVLGAARRRRQA